MQPEPPAKVSPQYETVGVDALRSEVVAQVGEKDFGHWFAGRTTFTIENDELVVGVGSPFLLNWMQRRFHQPLNCVAQRVLGPAGRIRLEVDSAISLTESASEASSAPTPAGSPTHAEPPSAGPSATPASLKRKFASMREFVRGRCNELAITAAEQVCQAPGAQYNPLYIHGGVGSGKTHLLEGIYGEIRRAYPSLRVMMLTSEAFTNYFTQALRDRTLPSFRQKFRNVDVLIVDDVDFLDSKRVVQEEFLHTFKQLESQGRQVVLSADRHPRLLAKLSEELTTRFLSGLVCRLETPDLVTRQQIVNQKAARLTIEIAADALEFVAKRFRNNVRELQGALNCLQTYGRMTGKRINAATARKVLADLERDCIRIVRIADIEQAVCRMFGVLPDELKSSRRSRSLTQPRMLAMFLARKHTQAAYSEIGKYFGGRIHSTVMSAEKKVLDWVATRSRVQVASQVWAFDEVVESLEQQLLAG